MRIKDRGIFNISIVCDICGKEQNLYHAWAYIKGEQDICGECNGLFSKMSKKDIESIEGKSKRFNREAERLLERGGEKKRC